MDLSKFFVKAPLIPVVCQDERSGEVLMLGYANEQALQLTMDTGTAWFFSRSRQKLWNKGETSSNFIFVKKILSDCDDDTLIYVGTPKGPVSDGRFLITKRVMTKAWAPGWWEV